MNTFLLLSALREVLTAEFLNLPLGCRSRTTLADGENLHATRPAHVFIGALPPKTPDTAEVVPFALIQTLDGFDDDSGFHTVRVALRLAVRDDDCEAAENDLHNLIGLVRRKVMSCRQSPLAGKFVLTADSQGKFAPWGRPDEQAPPFAEAYIITNWNMQGME